MSTFSRGYVTLKNLIQHRSKRNTEVEKPLFHLDNRTCVLKEKKWKWERTKFRERSSCFLCSTQLNGGYSRGWWMKFFPHPTRNSENTFRGKIKAKPNIRRKQRKNIEKKTNIYIYSLKIQRMTLLHWTNSNNLGKYEIKRIGRITRRKK